MKEINLNKDPYNSEVITLFLNRGYHRKFNMEVIWSQMLFVKIIGPDGDIIQLM